MRRPSVRTLIVVPWVLLTLASTFLFLTRAGPVTDQLIAIALLIVAINVPTAFVVANTIVHALQDLRAESTRLARLRSSPVDPQNLEELHTLRAAVTTATDELHTRAEVADLNARRFRAVLESLTEGVIQLTGDARFIQANQVARGLLLLPESVEGQSVAALVRHPELRSVLQRAARGTDLHPIEIIVDERQLLISPRRVQLIGGGDIPGAVVGIVDLTQLRRLETVRRDFVANVSHELKTPLTSIRGYTETLLNDDVPPELQKQFLDVIHANAERLQTIIDNLLDISRLQSGGWQPVLQPVNPVTMTNEVWTGIDASRREGVDFAISASTESLVQADPSGLRQILSNVLENALRHTPAGRIRVQVACVIGKEEAPVDRIEIAVSDNGTGIPRDALPRIFERFFRVDAGRRREDGGTGLGLSIVKHLVDSMGGSVSAESELGRGTTIRILLPAAKA